MAAPTLSLADALNITATSSDPSVVFAFPVDLRQAAIDALFGSTEQGFLIDPSDLSTMFQDSAGTIPVTTSGDPVGRINDLSGNGNHLIQTVSTERPTYETDGALHWLNFSVHSLSVALTRTGWTDAIAVSGAYSDRGQGAIIENLHTSGLKIHEPFSDNKWYVAFGEETRVSTGATLSYDTNYVLSRVRQSSVSSFRRNGVNVATGSSATTNYGSSDVVIGATSSNDNNLTGRIYALAVAEITSSSPISPVEDWVAEKSGITL